VLNAALLNSPLITGDATRMLDSVRAQRREGETRMQPKMKNPAMVLPDAMKGIQNLYRPRPHRGRYPAG
jgi:hypothetical protein